MHRKLKLGDLEILLGQGLGNDVYRLTRRNEVGICCINGRNIAVDRQAADQSPRDFMLLQDGKNLAKVRHSTVRNGFE